MRSQEERATVGVGGQEPVRATSRDNFRFFSWSARFYDLFLKAIFPGQLDRYRHLAAAQVAAPGTKRCLDVATGTGGNAFAFADVHRDHRIVAFDISREMLLEAQSKRNAESIDFVQGDAEHMPFKDEAFDLTMNSCAYHLLSPHRGWPEIYRVTRRPGRVVDIDIISRFLEHPFIGPLLRPCVIYNSIRSKRLPLEVPQSVFFSQLGLQDVREVRLNEPLVAIQIVVGERS